MAVIHDPYAWPIIDALVAALEVEVQCLDNPPAQVMARPGDQIELLLSNAGRDECCEGLGWVRCITIYPSGQNFPAPDGISTACGPLAWAVVLEIGIGRCAPVPGPQEIPSADDWNTVTAAVMDDAAAIRRAVRAFKTLDEWEDNLWLVAPWTPFRTEGGCVGGSMQVTIQATTCNEGSCS